MTFREFTRAYHAALLVARSIDGFVFNVWLHLVEP
jgi:hypothetical protein